MDRQIDKLEKQSQSGVWTQDRQIENYIDKDKYVDR